MGTILEPEGIVLAARAPSSQQPKKTAKCVRTQARYQALHPQASTIAQKKSHKKKTTALTARITKHSSAPMEVQKAKEEAKAVYEAKNHKKNKSPLEIHHFKRAFCCYSRPRGAQQRNNAGVWCNCSCYFCVVVIFFSIFVRCSPWFSVFRSFSRKKWWQATCFFGFFCTKQFLATFFNF